MEAAALPVNGRKGGRGGKGTGASFVYERLRDEILTLALAPGVDLDEAAIVARFGLSRTPVREALIRLASDGLVTMLPNRGAQVAALDVANFPRFFEAFDLVQRVVTRLAAQRRSEADLSAIRAAQEDFEAAVTSGDAMAMTARNREFHLTISAACRNPYFDESYRRLLDEGLRLMRIPFAYNPVNDAYSRAGHIDKIVAEHGAIIAAIDAQDAEAADRLAQSHGVLFRDRLRAYLEQNDTAPMVLSS